mmetsp:Transcript_3622/g.10680  ORF Transcript_3622/g.10680 Transcript_3622/m.10680 type:complete len:233 (-) Transcript_3622:396-1094(-)
MHRVDLGLYQRLEDAARQRAAVFDERQRRAGLLPVLNALVSAGALPSPNLSSLPVSEPSPPVATGAVASSRGAGGRRWLGGSLLFSTRHHGRSLSRLYSAAAAAAARHVERTLLCVETAGGWTVGAALKDTLRNSSGRTYGSYETSLFSCPPLGSGDDSLKDSAVSVYRAVPGEGNFLFGSADRLCFGGLDLGALELLSGILSSFLGVAPVSLHALMQALRGFVIRCGGNVK